MQKRCDQKANTDRVSPLLGHQLRSTPCQRLLVQAIGMSQHKAVNNACAYVPTVGTMAEEAPVREITATCGGLKASTEV